MPYRKLLATLLSVCALLCLSVLVVSACTDNSPGVVILSPADGATLSSASPLALAAKINSTQPITQARVYVNNNLRTSYSQSQLTATNDTINVSYNLAVGSYHIVINAWDATGQLYTSGVYIKIAANPPPSAAVTLSPSSATIVSGATQQFTASISNTTNQSVAWSATGGTVSPAGLFTAPSVSQNTAATVKATSVADPTKSAIATILIVPPTVSVVVSPATVTLESSQTTTFSASISNSLNQSVTWTATSGSITSGGIYTAPVVSSTSTATVTATSVSDPTKHGSTLVHLKPGTIASVTISPTAVSVTSGQTQQFAATVTGLSPPTVTWSAVIGTISSSGLYTAPSVTSQTADTVTATSIADPSKSARAAVTVMPLPETLTAILSVNPTSGDAPLTVTADSSQSSDTGGSISTRTINWGDSSSVAGQVSAQHTYATAGSYTITLSLVSASGKTSSASVGVTVTTAPPPPTVTISIAPTPTLTLDSGQTQQFQSFVSGTSNIAVTWRATAGTITAGGLYTAPSVTALANVTVSATSVADPTQIASTAVNVNPTGAVLGPATMLLGQRLSTEATSMADQQAIESWQGKKDALYMLFASFCNTTTYVNSVFNTQLPNVWAGGNVPIVTWYPAPCSGSTAANIDSQIASGTQDAYINQFLSALKTWLAGPDGVYGTSDDRRVYLRFAHDPNGNSYAWAATNSTGPGSGNTTTDYINMWHHVKDLATGLGLDRTHVQWIFSAVYADDPASHSMESYYPGDAYADWLMVEGLNTTTLALSPSSMFAPMLGRFSSLSALKPHGVLAGTDLVPDIPGKNAWIVAAYTYFAQQKLGMTVWYDRHTFADFVVFAAGETGDGTFVFGGTTYGTFSGYKSVVSSQSLIPSDPTNPRLLTEILFEGVNPPVAVTISPGSATIFENQTQQFSATVTNTSNINVLWSVDGVVGGSSPAGTVSTTGLYTAPASTGVHTVTATSQADSTRSASAAVTVSVPPNITVTVTPNPASLLTNQSLQFSAAVSNATNTAVTWAVDNVNGGSASAGTITSIGVYTAPATAGSHTVTATSVQDSTKKGSATVSVSAVSVAVSPASATLKTQAQQKFAATVSGSSNTGVNWSVDQLNGGSATVGTIDPTGNYVAPSSTGSHTVAATSLADSTKLGTAAVTVIANSTTGARLLSNSINGSQTSWQGLHFDDIRLWDQGAQWVNWGIWETCQAASDNPSDTCFSWTVFDQYLAMAAAHAEDNNLLYVMGHTPPWANPLPTASGCPVDSRIANGNMAPANLNVIGTAASAMMKHVQQWNTAHGKNVHVDFEGWNEPNSSNFWCSLQGTSSWTTTQKNAYSDNLLMQIHQIEYNAVKAVDPAILMVPAAPQGSASYTYVQRLYAANGNFPDGICPYTDVNSFHGYLGGTNFPETMPALMTNLVNAVSTNCKTRVWWDTEGYLIGATSADQQTAWMARKYLLALSLGNIDRTFWYQYGGTSGGVMTTCSGCGLNSTGQAWGYLYAWLKGSARGTTANPIASGSTTWSEQINNGSGTVPWTQALAVWNTAGANTFTVPAAYACHLYYTLTGTTGQIGVAGSTVPVGLIPILLSNQGASTASGCTQVTNFTLTISSAGTGTGSVTSSPAGITCPSACALSQPAGTVITLSATPTSGSAFAGWSGGGCSGTGACVVTLGADTTVTATFNLAAVQPALTITKSGTGTGTVSGGGLNCGSICSVSLTSGTVVTLNEVPTSNSVFVAWSGGCVGTSASCVLTVSANQTVNAQFTLVSVSVSPAAPSLAGGSTQQFTATVTGTANQAVTWTSSAPPGSITSGGLFTAPAVTTQTTYTVTATSAVALGSAATAQVTVTPAAPTTHTSSHVFLITLENTSAAATDPSAQCGTTGFPACTLDGTSTSTPIQCPTASGVNCTHSSYRRYMYGNTTDMPYFNNTLLPLGTRATNLYSDRHGSWNQWIYLVSGLNPASTNNEQCLNEDNLVRELIAKYGNTTPTWRAYSEGMPFTAFQQDNTTSSTCTDTTLLGHTCGYKRGHNPLINFTDTSQGSPNGLPTGCPESGQESNSVPTTNMLADFATTYAPRLTYITPDLGDDMHGSCAGCSFSTGQGLGHGNGSLQTSDSWLQSVVPTILARPEFQSGGDGVLVIFSDEGNTGANGGNPYAAGCSNATGSFYGGGCDTMSGPSTLTGGGGHIALLAIGPKIRVGSTATSTYHFSNIEKTLCTLLNLNACPGAGATASALDVFIP